MKDIELILIYVNIIVVREGNVQNVRASTKIPFICSQKKELRGLSPNLHIRVVVSDLYIPRIGPHIFLCYKVKDD